MSSNYREKQVEETCGGSEAEDEACLSAQLLCSSMVFPAILNAAIELNLFEIIAKCSSGNAMSVSEIASKLSTKPPHPQELPLRLNRMLRCLATHSLLTFTQRTNQDGTTESLFGLTPIGKYFVSSENGSLAPVSSLLYHHALLETWLTFKDGIVDPENDLFKKVHGIPMYQYVEKDQNLLQIFSKTTTNLCTLETRRILEMYRGFEGISTLVDVGGGSGQNLNMIISKYPSIKGINFDLPQVIKNAPAHPGIEHVGGDMLEGVPRGDAIILKAILHNWSDEKCQGLLGHCHKALPPKGKVVVVDMIMPEEPEPSEASKHISIQDNMRFISTGGRERTKKELEVLCKNSGFSEFELVCTAFSSLGVMEFRK